MLKTHPLANNTPSLIPHHNPVPVTLLDHLLAGRTMAPPLPRRNPLPPPLVTLPANLRYRESSR